MSDVVIRAEGLGKKYTIGHQSERERYYALRDVMARNLKNLWKGAKDLWSGNPVIQGAELEEYWALKDVSFEIKQGEAVGIIGRNGAGKTTLLKVLSRITEPSAGKVTIKGRVASLLEVGTGFHPELTGRENIFLNGAILGMSRKEIKSKFDEIVDFAEIEKFLDTPVKRYSSGMYVRLAFAVAAHLEPEILLVDEVLAVGDGEFQKKCLGKMGDVAQTGRTVFFVSHNMFAISEVCERTLLIRDGKISRDGTTREIISEYLNTGCSEAEIDLEDFLHHGPQEFCRLKRVRLLDQSGKPSTVFVMNESLAAQIFVQCMNYMPRAEIGLKISSKYGTPIHYFSSSWEGLSADLKPGLNVFEVVVPHLFLFPGTYLVGLWVSMYKSTVDNYVQEITHFTVIEGNVTGYPTWMEQYVVSGSEVYSPSKWKILNPIVK